MTTLEYLDAVKAAYCLTSDYQLAKKLSVGTTRITNYRQGRTVMDDDLAIKVAYLLDKNPLTVLADTHIEREQSKGHTGLVNFWKEVRRSGVMNYANLAHVAQ